MFKCLEALVESKRHISLRVIAIIISKTIVAAIILFALGRLQGRKGICSYRQMPWILGMVLIF